VRASCSILATKGSGGRTRGRRGAGEIIITVVGV